MIEEAAKTPEQLPQFEPDQEESKSDPNIIKIYGENGSGEVLEASLDFKKIKSAKKIGSTMVLEAAKYLVFAQEHIEKAKGGSGAGKAFWLGPCKEHGNPRIMCCMSGVCRSWRKGADE